MGEDFSRQAFPERAANAAAAPILPIDYFFRSLAEDRGELAIGIALSGTGSDGTLGVRAIKEAGGTVMVQDEESARFSGMPDSAAATGLADYVLPPAEMARELLLFIRHPLVAQMKEAALNVGQTTMQKIVSLIHEQTGIDFTSYKQVRWRAASSGASASRSWPIPKSIWNFSSNCRRKSRCSGATC